MWELTAAELDELIAAGRAARADEIRENELLAFNIGALVLAAFNAPQRFPKTPDAAFGRKPEMPADGGKSSFAEIAARLNKRLAERTGENKL
ncbi:MAG: hypothetical protein II820_05570 [Ruminiclostridium sp.]|nr:hypothetical protein [Ruminiclostridium sp.]